MHNVKCWVASNVERSVISTSGKMWLKAVASSTPAPKQSPMESSNGHFVHLLRPVQELEKKRAARLVTALPRARTPEAISFEIPSDGIMRRQIVSVNPNSELNGDRPRLSIQGGGEWTWHLISERIISHEGRISKIVIKQTVIWNLNKHRALHNIFILSYQFRDICLLIKITC